MVVEGEAEPVPAACGDPERGDWGTVLTGRVGTFGGMYTPDSRAPDRAEVVGVARARAAVADGAGVPVALSVATGCAVGGVFAAGVPAANARLPTPGLR